MLPQTFIMREEEELVLDDGSAHRTPELVQAERILVHAIEVIAGIHRVVANVFEQAAVQFVAARFGDDADLAAGPGAVFGGVVAGFHAELLHRFEAGLQAEGRGSLAVQVAGRGIHNRGAFHAIELYCVLLIRLPTEADVVKGTAAGGLRSGSQEVQLRNLAPVDGHFRHFAGIYVGSDGGGTGFHHGQIAARNRDGGGDSRSLQGDVQGSFLADRQVDVFVCSRFQPGGGCGNGIGGGRKAGGEVDAGSVANRFTCRAGLLVNNFDGDVGEDTSRSVRNGAGEAGLIHLCESELRESEACDQG